MDLYLFSSLLDNRVLRDLGDFRYNEDAQAGRRACGALLCYAARAGRRGDALRQYVAEALLDCPGVGAVMAHPALAHRYLEQDVAVIWREFFEFDWAAHAWTSRLLPFPTPEEGEALPNWLRPLVEADSAAALLEAVRAFYDSYSSRDEARYQAFRWEGESLRGVERPEGQRFEDLAGLEHQKQALLDNARAFLDGAPAHNVLLVGSSGTGKSSCVKATLTRFAGEGLRLVELPRSRVEQLPRLMEELRDKRQRYIVYIDDLSFEEVDGGYKALKVALEGQVEERLDHVLLYVTSNRRNLVRESWKDRDGDEEIHQNDNLHEKRSLSERFGLRLYFGVLSQKEYFQVVRLLLSRNGVAFTEEIGAQASAWALNQGGRSGRCARQFVEDFLARASRGE